MTSYYVVFLIDNVVIHAFITQEIPTALLTYFHEFVDPNGIRNINRIITIHPYHFPSGGLSTLASFYPTPAMFDVIYNEALEGRYEKLWAQRLVLDNLPEHVYPNFTIVPATNTYNVQLQLHAQGYLLNTNNLTQPKWCCYGW